MTTLEVALQLIGVPSHSFIDEFIVIMATGAAIAVIGFIFLHGFLFHKCRHNVVCIL